jgi:ArsR family transcriptional regulator, arsenate/arsenite/antimonite-responsive transcriptional repressor
MTKGVAVRDFELALKAAGDPTRTRILKLLERGGLCVCQVQAVLGLAPSTVSKHLAILRTAGLVVDQRDGKWTEYALAEDEQNRYARAVLAMLRGPLDHDPSVEADRMRLREIKAIPMEALCGMTPLRPPGPTATGRRRSNTKERQRA